MANCPWYVSAHAVRQYLAVTGRALSFDDASDELIEMCAETWQRYEEGDGKPVIDRHGAYMYRGPKPLRLRFIVVIDRRTEGAKPQLVDVVPAHAGLQRRHPGKQ